jgi:photosystem II stability/assembly factor-like uncharacterized protein
MKNIHKRLGLIVATIMVLSLFNIPALAADSTQDIAAVPVQYSLSVDGKSVSLWVYEIGSGVYFKLRDLAMALDGTDKQFEVKWDGERNEVDLYAGTAYTPVGGELSAPAKTALVSAAVGTAFFWGYSLSTYVINDHHYIRLSDLAAALHFSTACDDKTHTAAVNTANDTINVSKSTGQAKAINDIALMDAGYSWTINGNGNVVLSYNAGDGPSTVVTPATVEKNDSGEYIHNDAYPGVYMSEEKTAVAYGGYNGGALYVICSDDMGKTWSAPVLIQNSVGVSSLYISFATKDDGWLVIGNFHGMGNEDNFVYRTVDGGKTWTQLGNPNQLYSRMITGAGFSNNEIGFLSFRFEFSDFSPAICRTLDGGQTWEKLNVTLPKEFDQYYSKTPLSPAF